MLKRVVNDGEMHEYILQLSHQSSGKAEGERKHSFSSKHCNPGALISVSIPVTDEIARLCVGFCKSSTQ